MWADFALSFFLISPRISKKFLMLISPLYSLRTSINRLIWVPLKWWGRSTYMFILAMVCWVPLALSRTTMGYLISFTPTLSISIFLVSGRLWISFMTKWDGKEASFLIFLFFIVRGTGILRFPDIDLAYLDRVM